MSATSGTRTTSSDATTRSIACRRCSHIDWGLSIVKADVLARQPADTAFDLAEFTRVCARRGQLAGYEVTTRFYEIGSQGGCAKPMHCCAKALIVSPQFVLGRLAVVEEHLHGF